MTQLDDDDSDTGGGGGGGGDGGGRQSGYDELLYDEAALPSLSDSDLDDAGELD